MTALWLAWLLASGPQAAGYRIAGTVVNSATREPVAGARVTIAPMEHRDQQIPFVTGQDGRFLFVGMPKGRYDLMARKRGFLTASYGQRAGLSGALVAGTGEQTADLVLPLPPPAVITGKVLDDAGDPVAQAVVELLDSTIVGGHRRLARYAVERTNDLGEYRFHDLPEGNYYLTVSGYPWYTKYIQTLGDGPPRSMTHAGFAMRYYPNVADPAAAAPLTLKPGQEAAADFTLLAVPAVTLTVHVEGSEDLSKQFSLAAAGIAGNQVVMRQGSETGDLYHFWGVPPGRYLVRVQAADGDRSWFARDTIDVGAADAEVTVALREAPSIGGMVAFEGAGVPAGVSVELTDTETGGVQTIQLGPGGKFSLPAIAPQRCRLVLAGTDEFYLKDWSVEGGRRDGDALEIREGSPVRLKLFAAKGAGRIGGTVYSGGHPRSGALVVLIPGARAVESDSDGGYEFTGLPPGAYSVFAVADGADLEYANALAIQPYMGAAQKVRVAAAGGSYTQRLDLP